MISLRPFLPTGHRVEPGEPETLFSSQVQWPWLFAAAGAGGGAEAVAGAWR